MIKSTINMNVIMRDVLDIASIASGLSRTQIIKHLLGKVKFNNATNRKYITI